MSISPARGGCWALVNAVSVASWLPLEYLMKFKLSRGQGRWGRSAPPPLSWTSQHGQGTTVELQTNLRKEFNGWRKFSLFAWNKLSALLPVLVIALTWCMVTPVPCSPDGNVLAAGSSRRMETFTIYQMWRYYIIMLDTGAEHWLLATQFQEELNGN